MTLRLIHIVEPTLDSLRGHPYWFAKQMAAQFRDVGLEVRVHGQATLHPDVPAGEVEPLFSQHPMTRVSQDPVAGMLEDFVLRERVFAAELAALFRQIDPVDEGVLFPTNYPMFVPGVGRCLSDWGDVPLPKMVMVHAVPSGVDMAAGKLGMDAMLYRYGFNLIPKHAPVQSVVVTEVEAQEYEFLSRRKTMILPFATNGGPNDPVNPPNFAEPRVTVFVPGRGHRIHGRHLLGAIIAACRERGLSGLRFLFQGPIGEHSVPDGTDIELVELPLDLSQADYLGCFQAADIALLPYDPAMFRSLTSGQFALACTFDCVCVTADGTWMARELARAPRAGSLMSAQTPDAAAAALAASLIDLPERKRAATILGDHYRSVNRSDLFAQRIVELLS